MVVSAGSENESQFVLLYSVGSQGLVYRDEISGMQLEDWHRRELQAWAGILLHG